MKTTTANPARVIPTIITMDPKLSGAKARRHQGNRIRRISLRLFAVYMGKMGHPGESGSGVDRHEIGISLGLGRPISDTHGDRKF